MRLQVAVDHVAAMREARGHQHLLRDRDRARRVERRCARRSPSATRPRSTPSRCSRCRRTRRGRRRRRRSGAAARPRRTPRAGSAPRTPGPAQTARAAASARPCGRGVCPRRSRRRPSRRRRSCAGRDSGRRSRSLGDLIRSSSCITCFAIGAATVPPWPVVRSTVTAIATRGPLHRGEGDEPCLVRRRPPRPSRSCPPRRCPRARPPCRCPPSRRCSSSPRAAPPCSASSPRSARSASSRRTSRRRGRVTCSTRCGRIRLPPFRDRGRARAPSAAASPAVAPGRSRRGRCRPRREAPQQLAVASYTPLARISSRGQVDQRLAVEAEAPHVLVHRPSCRASPRPLPRPC